VACILKSPQLAEQDRMAQVNVRSRGIDTELDAQGSPCLLSLSQACGQGLVGVGVSRGEEI
jgi:hypothetical protein